MNGILFMNTKILENDILFHKGMKMISQNRREKISKMKNPVSVRLSLGAGILLKIALDQNGLADKIEDIKTGKHGKPYLKDTDFHFNLSHSGEYAVCVYADVPIGVDLQIIKESIPAHTKRILSEEEKEFLNSLSETEKIEAFYRLWARKESLIKWDGRGLRLSLEELSFISSRSMTDQITFDDKTLYFKEYDFFLPEYSFCICSEKNIFCESIEEITSKFLTKY